MTLAEFEVELPDDVMAHIRSQMRSGQYAYADEVIAVALYSHMEDRARQGVATAILDQPLEQLLSDLRRAIAAQRRKKPPEILDIGEVIDRWEEIMARVEAGEPVIIAIDGVPKARLEPVSLDMQAVIITAE